MTTIKETEENENTFDFKNQRENKLVFLLPDIDIERDREKEYNMHSIIKDTIADGDTSIAPFKDKAKKPIYSQIKNKSKKSLLKISPEDKNKKKKKVRFKLDFIDEKLIESYKEYNLLMTYSEFEVQINEVKKENSENCKKCLSKCSIF